MKIYRKSNHQGYSLLEMLSVLLIISILVLIAINLRPSISRTEHEIIISELKVAVEFSRVQAISLDRTLHLISTDDANWSSGASLIDPKTQKVIHQWQWRHHQWQVLWKGAVSKKYIVFAADPLEAMANGQFIISNSYTKEQQRLVLNRLGRSETRT